MKHFAQLFLCLFVTCFAGIAHADTVDYWHVYRNGEKIFDSMWVKDPVVRLTTLKAHEQIGIGYYHDTYTLDKKWQSIELWTEDRKLWKRYEATQEGWPALYSPASDLLSYWREHKGKLLYLTFKQEGYGGVMTKDSLVVLSE